MGSSLKYRQQKVRGRSNANGRRIEASRSKNSRLDVLKKYGALLKTRRTLYVLFTLAFLSCSGFFKFFGINDGQKRIVFASADEIADNKGMALSCSRSYLEDIAAFEGCVPSYCGRAVTDNIITTSEAEVLLNLARRGFDYGGSEGGASILDLHSGALSKGKKFINIYSIIGASELFLKEDLITYRLIRRKIQNVIADRFNISKTSLHLTHPTFFSLLTNKNAATVHDEYWHTHVDKETYKSFHYTTLLYLNNYGKDFTGGRFIFDEKDNSSTIVEPKQARLSVFTSGSENPHHVERVQSGARYAVTISFTCDPKNAISDPGPE